MLCLCDASGSPTSDFQGPLDSISVKKKRKERQLILVDTDLRRSLRLKAHSSGFKPSRCGKKQWLGCDLDPPSLPMKVIKNLGEQFCNVAPENLIIEALKSSKVVNKAVMK
jgi:hypothetical protein